MLSALRKLFFWNYARNTWQWDALCVLILCFIFLTPKSWFENSELKGRFRHLNSAGAVLLISPEVIDNAEDKPKLQQRLRELTGRTDLQVLDVRKLSDAQGKIKGYEVDIR